MPGWFDPFLWTVLDAVGSCLGWDEAALASGGAAVLGAIPALGWIVYSADYLLSSRSGSWIGPLISLCWRSPGSGLGLWPCPSCSFWSCSSGDCSVGVECNSLPWRQNRLLDRSALVALSSDGAGRGGGFFVKPLAFSRYFVVLLPSVLPLMAVLLTASPLHRAGQRVALGVLILLLISWWGPVCGTGSRCRGARTGSVPRDQSAHRWGEDRYSPRARLFNLSDQMELAMGRISAQSSLG